MLGLAGACAGSISICFGFNLFLVLFFSSPGFYLLWDIPK